jgi:hypothetical protein
MQGVALKETASVKAPSGPRQSINEIKAQRKLEKRK